MADFKATRAGVDNKNNVRKSLGAIAFIADVTEAPLETISGTAGTLATIPAPWRALGMFSEDGLSFTKEIEFEEVLAHGYKTYVRRDASSETHGVSLTALEVDRKVVAELRHGVDLSDVTPDANGEIKITVPELDNTREYRLLAISMDINKETGAEIYRAKQYRNISVSTFPEEAWSADPVQAAFEFTAKADEDGVVLEEFVAGPGVVAEDLGYTVAAGE